MSDYHLHLHPHRPLPGTPPMGEYLPGYIDRYVEVAQSRGVAEIGFTEHLYRCVEAEAALGRPWEHENNPLLAAQTREMITRERNLSLDKSCPSSLMPRRAGCRSSSGWRSTSSGAVSSRYSI